MLTGDGEAITYWCLLLELLWLYLFTLTILHLSKKPALGLAKTFSCIFIRTEGHAQPWNPFQGRQRTLWHSCWRRLLLSRYIVYTVSLGSSGMVRIFHFFPVRPFGDPAPAPCVSYFLHSCWAGTSSLFTRLSTRHIEKDFMLFFLIHIWNTPQFYVLIFMLRPHYTQATSEKTDYIQPN